MSFAADLDLAPPPPGAPPSQTLREPPQWDDLLECVYRGDVDPLLLALDGLPPNDNGTHELEQESLLRLAEQLCQGSLQGPNSGGCAEALVKFLDMLGGDRGSRVVLANALANRGCDVPTALAEAHDRVREPVRSSLFRWAYRMNEAVSVDGDT